MEKLAYLGCQWPAKQHKAHLPFLYSEMEKAKVKQVIRVILVIFPGSIYLLIIALWFNIVFPGLIGLGMGIMVIVKSAIKLAVFDLSSTERADLKSDCMDALGVAFFGFILAYLEAKGFIEGKSKL